METLPLGETKLGMTDDRARAFDARRGFVLWGLVASVAASSVAGCGSTGDRPDSLGGGSGDTTQDGAGSAGGSGGDGSSDGSGSSGGSADGGGGTDPAVVDCVAEGSVTSWPKAASNSTRTVGIAVVDDIFHVVYGDRSPSLNDQLWERLFSGATAGGSANLIASSAPNANSVRLRFDASGRGILAYTDDSGSSSKVLMAQSGLSGVWAEKTPLFNTQAHVQTIDVAPLGDVGSCGCGSRNPTLRARPRSCTA